MHHYLQLVKNFLPPPRFPITHQQFIDQAPLDNLNRQEKYWVKKLLAQYFHHHSTSLTKSGFASFHLPEDTQGLEAWNDQDANFCFVANYHQVIEKIANECKQLGVKIFLQSEVSKIIQTNQVIVKTASQSFQADKLISTIPVGVLKHTPFLFEPDLSQEKWQAIQALGVHQATRIVLEFDQPFWNIHSPYLWLDHPSSPTLKEFRNNYFTKKALLQTDSYTHIARSLYQKLDAPQAKEALIATVMKDLTQMYPHASWPTAYIYDWTSDPYARGSYPYRHPNITERLQQALERQEGNLYFAGADFSRHGFSIHNAYASGKRIAKAINQL